MAELSRTAQQHAVAAPVTTGAATAPRRILLLRLAAAVARRALMLVVLLAAVFVAVELLPGDAASASSERGDSAADVAARRHLLGLDRPVWERFADWMTALPTGDLGTSARGQKVTDLLADPLPNTLILGGTAFALTVVASLALGCWAATRPGRLADRIIGHTSTAAFAVPEFVVSVGLLLVLSLWTGWLPAVTLTGADGSLADWTMLIMPVLALVIPQAGWNTRIVRGALADQARTPHVEAAHLDGLPVHRVVLRHALPGAIPAIATGIATSTGMLLGGAVVVETLFNYPGIGSVMAAAVSSRDTPLIAGVVVCAGAAISLVLLAADLIRARTLGGRQ
ncbi:MULTISPECIES: ABC transporter permease [unclassified Streptomyces]|uniref:ABC transporter permease n=2 Tax=unclassified Streptomyces TaxID=2593676 RepID=UPI002253A577|nr:MULTISPECIES: ABC transporter permease [unclassified Streptomyces]MCX4631275.1 ABC transporter permease [Streptomyces sp. NBC_01443]